MNIAAAFILWNETFFLPLELSMMPLEALPIAE
jgi:hypothetical protein